jgi:hypothetical protein
MPTFQKCASGRDHNSKGFTVWRAGAGVKRAFSRGSTDEFGYKGAAELGLDHEELTFYHNGSNRLLTEVHGHIIHHILRTSRASPHTAP